jgi:hypothetical protein
MHSEAGYDLLILPSKMERHSSRMVPVGEHNADGLIVFTSAWLMRRSFTSFQEFPLVCFTARL